MRAAARSESAPAAYSLEHAVRGGAPRSHDQAEVSVSPLIVFSGSVDEAIVAFSRGKRSLQPCARIRAIPAP
jgi:hypothetical protein